MDAATQVPLNKMNGKQLKAARAHVEMLWGKIKHETTWARFVRIEDYNDAPIFENEDHLRYLASLSRPRRINIVQVPDGLQTALGYLKRGWNPVPVSRETKTPIGVAWQKRRLDRKTVHEHFNGADMNTGVQLGPYSNGLTDVDLDCREALIVGALLLPKGDNVFGRKSKPRSHWLYTTTLADTNECAGLQFRDADGEKGRNGTMMLELRFRRWWQGLAIGVSRQRAYQRGTVRWTSMVRSSPLMMPGCCSGCDGSRSQPCSRGIGLRRAAGTRRH